jgi:hypothetical protein
MKFSSVGLIVTDKQKDFSTKYTFFKKIKGQVVRTMGHLQNNT